jgi:hypothetical protein
VSRYLALFLVKKRAASEQRTRGRTHRPVTRLMSPSDLGEILKPFVFLDLFDHEGAPSTVVNGERVPMYPGDLVLTAWCSGGIC